MNLTHTRVLFAIRVVQELLLEKGRFGVLNMGHGVHLHQNAKVIYSDRADCSFYCVYE